MTLSEPAASAVQSPDDLRAFIGQRVQVFRDNAQEGTGELVDVIAGEFQQWTPDGVITVPVEDKDLRWIDDTAGDLTSGRRQSNVWRLVPVE